MDTFTIVSAEPLLSKFVLTKTFIESVSGHNELAIFFCAEYADVKITGHLRLRVVR